MVSKKTICCVALQLRRCGAHRTAVHPQYLRAQSHIGGRAFYETVVALTYYDIIEFDGGQKRLEDAVSFGAAQPKVCEPQ